MSWRPLRRRNGWGSQRRRGSRGTCPGAGRAWHRCPSPRPVVLEYQQRLERSGFIIDTIVLFPRPTVLPTGLDGWLDIFGATFLNAVPASDRPRLRARVAELAAPLLRTADGSWRADYVRLRFRAWLGDDN